MSLFCRQACGRLAFLAILAGIVLSLVACEAGPGTSAQPDPVKIKAVTFEKVGTAREIPLGDKFSGEELTYTATSSNKAVATVEVDNDEDILAVTAVGAGEATITVTAADSQDRTASQAFKVTVKATTSEPEPGAPTVRTGATASVDVDQGDTETVTLSRVFTGEDLEFSVTSSATGVATARIDDDGILTISARSPGEATITVTATNDDGNIAHSIIVTVPGLITTPLTTTPTTSSCKSPLTIKLHATAKCTLSSKEQILRSDSDGVTVVRSPAKDTEWSIRAEEKGPHKVSIISTGASNSGEKLGEITVEVPNSHPILTDADHDGIRIDLTADTPMNTHDLLLPTAHFSDPDGTTDVKYYRIASKPDWFLIDTEDGFVMDGDDNEENTVHQLVYEVLKEVKAGVENTAYDFTVSLYGSDGEDDSTLPLVLKFNAPSGGILPREVPYELNQRGARKDFYNDAKLDSPPANKLDVGPRRGVSHTVTFTLTDATGGFGFANSLHQKWKDDGNGKLDESLSVTTTDAHYLGEDGNYVLPLPDEQGAANKKNRAEGINYFILKSTGAVVAKWATNPALGSNPVVKFELKETGSSGTIKIEYYVWVLSRDQKTTADGVLDSSDPRDEIPTTRRSDSRTLTIKVVSCSSPPDPIAACP